jgi:hypothetical protein
MMTGVHVNAMLTVEEGRLKKRRFLLAILIL